MKTDRNKIKEIIREMISEIDINESDIIAKDKSKWNDMKKDFKKSTSILLKNIEKDNYSDVEGDIENTIRILKSWKKRLSKNLDDSSRF